LFTHTLGAHVQQSDFICNAEVKWVPVESSTSLHVLVVYSEDEDFDVSDIAEDCNILVVVRWVAEDDQFELSYSEISFNSPDENFSTRTIYTCTKEELRTLLVSEILLRMWRQRRINENSTDGPLERKQSLEQIAFEIDANWAATKFVVIVLRLFFFIIFVHIIIVFA